MGCCVSKPTTLTTKDPFPDAQNSAEYWAFRKCYGVLADGIYDPGQLAVNLFSTELIERNVRIEAQKPAVEEKVKIGNLLTAVEAQILTSPTTKFTIFLDVLQAEPSLQHLATRLKETYGELTEYSDHKPVRTSPTMLQPGHLAIKPLRVRQGHVSN